MLAAIAHGTEPLVRRTHSTGALSVEQRARQEALYREGLAHDYLIVGTGMAALALAALLARTGARVLMLEAHDRPGGYVHTFRMADWAFCAQIHYIWGCGPGQRIDRFLRKLGLESEITFEPLDPAGYDHVVLPGGRRVLIPCGFEALARNIDEAFPGQGEKVRRFTRILDRISHEVEALPDQIRWWQYLTRFLEFRTLLRHRNATLGQVFDECELSPESRAILIANCGNFMCPPRDLSILAYNGLFSGYNRGAWYPTNHFGPMVDRLVHSITDHPGCHILYEHEVVAIQQHGDRITGVRTGDGKTFTAPVIICNMDPRRAASMIGRDRFPPRMLDSLSYEYSGTAVTLYLGVQGIDLRDHGFGRHNTWHLEQWDMDRAWDESMAGDWSRPWMFLATPSLHTSVAGTTPPGGQILELATSASYDQFRELFDTDRRAYLKKKNEVRDRLIDLAEQRYIPSLRKHVVLKVAGSPTTNEAFCLAPRGNAYGQDLVPGNMGTGRLRAQTPWKNFFWCNASSGYPGVHGTIGTGMRLYMDLTGDRCFTGV